MMLPKFTGVVLLLMLAPVLGCGGSSKLDTAPTRGTVTLGGKPVEGALVSFFPKEGGRKASGTTDAEGKFALTTYNSGDGASPGEYDVTIVREEATDSNTPEELAKAKESALPERYSSAETSGLTAEVPEGGKTDFLFELVSK